MATEARSNGSNGKVAATKIVRRAVEQVRELTGRPVEGVLGLERVDDGWVVTLEVVELRRVPDSTDVLGSYAVGVDTRGELQEYRRTRRYYRSQVEEG
ncbi:MAG: gas vesicle protein GvpO [Thermoleophilaceae bacterium]